MNKQQTLRNALQHIRGNTRIPKGRLKRVQQQLRIENELLTKSGRPLLPSTLHQLVVREYHNIAHFGTDKVYDLLKERFCLPYMYNYVRNFTAAC